MSEKYIEHQSHSILNADIDWGKVQEGVARLDEVKKEMDSQPLMRYVLDLVRRTDLLSPEFSETEFIKALESVEEVGALTEDQQSVIWILLQRHKFIRLEHQYDSNNRDFIPTPAPANRRLKIRFH